MMLGEERKRVEGERNDNLKALKDAFGEVARREAETLSAMVERARAKLDRGPPPFDTTVDSVQSPPFKSSDDGDIATRDV